MTGREDTLQNSSQETSHWTLRSEHSWEWEAAHKLYAATVEVEVEVPRDADGNELERTGRNIYFPTMVKVCTDDSHDMSGVGLLADDARRLADLLTLAADACDRIDQEAMAR